MKQASQRYGMLILGGIGLYYLLLALYTAQTFLIPLTTAIILALVLFPLAKRLEDWGLQRIVGSTICTLVLLVASLFLVGLVAYQSKIFMDQWETIKGVLEPNIAVVQQWVTDYTPLTTQELVPSASNLFKIAPNPGSHIAGALGAVTGFLGNYLLTIIYVFFLLQYRARFRLFVLRLFASEAREQVEHVIQKSAQIAPQYLIGKLILMGGLAVIYSIGLGVSGVDNFILISLIAAVLTLIPYLGNIFGFALALVLGYLTTGDWGILIGIILTFGIGQFVETYVLQPYVVGDRVDVHPFFTIVVVVAGNFLWGVVGTMLSIPILGIITVIMLHVPSLHSVGLLLSTRPISMESEPADTSVE